MTERLTTEQLEAIRKRAEAATSGPWRYNAQYGYLAPVTPQRQIATIANEITRGYDAEFITEAREDIPALLAEVERLRGVINKAIGNLEWNNPKDIPKAYHGLMEAIRNDSNCD